MNTRKPTRSPWIFVSITFSITWLLLLPGVLAHYRLIPDTIPALAFVALAQFGPSATAFILTYRDEGGSGLKKLLKRAVGFRVSRRWLAATVLIPLSMGAAALSLYILSTGDVPELAMLSQPVTILPTFVMIMFFMGPVPEEFGWRGYLLDRLQAKWSALASSLILGVIWAVWHLPSWFMDGTFQSFAPFWAFLIFDVALSILFTWVYNNTGGNLFLALLFHTMINLANRMFVFVGENASGNAQIFIYLVALYAITAILIGKVWEPWRLSRRRSAERA
jgi:membrane protease YdiL (CAAX protease family)